MWERWSGKPSSGKVAGTYSVSTMDYPAASGAGGTVKVRASPTGDSYVVTRQMEDEPERKGVGILQDDLFAVGMGPRGVSVGVLARTEGKLEGHAARLGLKQTPLTLTDDKSSQK